MFEKVNPAHPDKVADRIAGAIVDYCYTIDENPKVAVEVLIGHGKCNIIAESSINIPIRIVDEIVWRIGGNLIADFTCVPQDIHIAKNQDGRIRCGDNGIFKGVPLTGEQKQLSIIAQDLYDKYGTDGKYILDGDKLIICQSCADSEELRTLYPNAIVNPLGNWTGGTNVDTGATNRKLGSDMADSISGGGINGKDCSKADVSINIYAFIMAQLLNREVRFSCAIGDEVVDGKPYSEIVKIARNYIDYLGGFEKFSEWGFI